MTYKQLKEKLASGDYDDLSEDLYLEWQMCGDQYKSVEEMIEKAKEYLASWLCEDFPDRYHD